jgi:hypothetical protein
VERRLHQPPLAPVVLALAGQQPLAQQHLELLERARLLEARVVVDEDLLDQRGVLHEREAHEQRPRHPHGDVRDLAVPPQLGEVAQRVAPQRGELPHARGSVRTRGQHPGPSWHALGSLCCTPGR